MAVPVQQHFAGKLRRLVAGRMALEKLAEKKRLASQLHGARIPRKQIAQFVAKDGCAARFQHDDGHARVNSRAQNGQNLLQILLGLVEHAEIVERPSAAQVACGTRDSKPAFSRTSSAARLVSG